MRRSYFLLFTVHCLLFTVFLWGCGSLGGESISAPPGSTITIYPESLTVTSLAGDTDFNFTVVVESENGDPLGNIEIWISGNFAAPRTPIRYQFCRNSDGIDRVNSSFSAETNDLGVYYFSIIVPAMVDGEPNVFEDDIEVRSGSAFASAHLSFGS
jgi:hypothetical protein